MEGELKALKRTNMNLLASSRMTDKEISMVANEQVPDIELTTKILRKNIQTLLDSK